MIAVASADGVAQARARSIRGHLIALSGPSAIRPGLLRMSTRSASGDAISPMDKYAAVAGGFFHPCSRTTGAVISIRARAIPRASSAACSYHAAP